DGIRDRSGTGVQACALPISLAVGLLAGVFNDVAEAGAARAGLGLDDRSQDGAHGALDLAGAVAVGTGAGRGAGPLAGAIAHRAEIGRASCRGGVCGTRGAEW